MQAKKFIRQEEIEELSLLYHVECLEDEDEQLRWGKRGDPILHIELRKWADALIIAPLSANTLAKITNGQCDNLVTLVCRCWDMKLRSSQDTGEERPRQVKLAKPIIVAPAMNTMMWEHPITEEQLDRLRSWGYTIANPIEKLLMCGDQGRGAMAHIETITAALSA
jgi:phosphopantothenoylcysteine decarboxylase